MNFPNYTNSTWMRYKNQPQPAKDYCCSSYGLLIFICHVSHLSLVTLLYCEIFYGIRKKHMLVRFHVEPFLFRPILWYSEVQYQFSAQWTSLRANSPALLSHAFFCYLFFFYFSYILDCLSFSPLAAPDLPHRLLLNSFSVSVAWRGKDANNMMQPCSSVSLDSGCCSLIAFPIIELRRCTHSSNLRHKRCRLWAEFNKLPFPPQHSRKGCSSWAVDELYSMEITSQLIL